MFNQIDPKLSQNDLEKAVLEYWRREKIFQKVQEARKDAKLFVFFEGPPTANAKPGFHHVEARAFKDLIPRYQTMRGLRVDRKAGWDTHGLPVELQVEKKLGLKNKKDIEAYGIAKFNAECKSDVWTFKQDWEKLTERIGFWLDLENPYITYENSYIESVWHVLKAASMCKDTLGRSLLYQGHKVVPYCTRCGTALSSHEVAQGYKGVTENSVYVKFKLKNHGENTSILAWTTTPWTLPGNVALAVGAKIMYSHVRAYESDGNYIVAKDRVEKLQELQIIGDVITADFESGSEMELLEYEPLFPGIIEKNENAFKIYTADFVTTDDGTGVVHTAVMYGEDDYVLGGAAGLPTEHTVGEDGCFLSTTGRLAGLYVKDPETEKLILKLLDKQLLKTVPYTHDYPFCWRCDTALLYYARSSWFIRMSELRDELTKRNNTINWEPKTIQQGRMGEWLENAKDWAISRERYWGTPLPFWQCEDGHLTVVSSLNELNQKAVNRTHFYYLRHGQSQKNVENINSSWPEPRPMPLTKLGQEQAEVVAASLQDKSIDLIVSSDLLRAQQTAGIVAKKLGVEIVYDPDLREINTGSMNGGDLDAHGGYRELITKNLHDRYYAKPEGGECLDDVRKRMVLLVSELGKKYPGKTVLLISHGDPLLTLELVFSGQWGKEILIETSSSYIQPAEVREMVVPNWPFNEQGEVDLHRPYIDEIEIKCDECGRSAKRVKEVADVWFDSGSMPYAQWSYPQADGSEAQFEAHYPADYISEAIDQTRGWFYTLLAVATILEKEAPFKNVICLGHVLDQHGKKMSKSKGNIVDPWSLIEKYGADTVRFYFYSVNASGEPKLFVEKDVQTVQRKVLMLWQNVYSFFITYANQAGWKIEYGRWNMESRNILDQWVLSRLNQVTQIVTGSLDSYDALTASRALADFIDDLSTWYLRRSRSRFAESNDADDREAAFSTLYHALVTLSQLMAPFTPFTAESIYLHLVGESVHLTDWPKAQQLDQNVIKNMKIVREIVSSGLDARMKAGIKVRQKLGVMAILGDHQGLLDTEAYFNIIRDEVNVVTVARHPNVPIDWIRGNAGLYEVAINPEITPDLKRDGMQRELMRSIQDMRKHAGLSVQDKAHVTWHSLDSEIIALMNNSDICADLQIGTRSTILRSAGPLGQEFNVNGHSITIGLKKVE